MNSRICELELKVLYEISRIIGRVLQLEQALETILSILSETLSMKRGTVTLQEEKGGRLKIFASHGMTAEEQERGVYCQDEGVTGMIFRSAQPFVVPDIGKEPLFLNKTRSRPVEKGGLAFIGVPIMLHKSPIGVLNVDRLFGDDISFEEDVRFLTIVGTFMTQFIMLDREIKQREDRLRRENRCLKAEISRKYNHFFMVGKSPAMVEAQGNIEKVAPSRAPVLLLGESGTGKTLIARIIHELSDRARHPFIKINCSSFTETLLESELFGYERGAFTGATASKAGRFEEADGGTVFLDEIGELPLNIQAKLLRFLQDKELERPGSTRNRKVDVRIVTATNKDLEKAIRDGTFREDLYYRLNVFPMRVPPLRERREDIPLLVDYFLEKVSKEYGRKFSFSPHALEVLAHYDWPGNVREMENLVERLAIVAEASRINVEELPAYIFSRRTKADRAPSPEAFSRLEEMERREIVAALERNNWVQSRAARDLGLTLRQIGYRIKKFGLENLIVERRARAAARNRRP